MFRIFIIIPVLLVAMKSIAETLVLEKRSYTYNGVTTNFVLEVDVADIEKTTKLDPAKDKLPLSMQKAIKLATSAYKKEYGQEPRGVASITLTRFSSWDYDDRWYFLVNLTGNPGVQAAVLLNEKVILPRKI
ncbi:MAG: hypothetical protein JSU67_10600 [Gammaproteobacteria bacterium]|nr:MAG: hypothetical protein JSU67_10600 [Gammaproteobacteria bacterium]